MDELVEDLRGFVRKSPAVAIGAAVGLGFVLARLAKAGAGYEASGAGNTGSSANSSAAPAGRVGAPASSQAANEGSAVNPTFPA